MTTSSSLTAGWLDGIAFDVGFKRPADVGCVGGDGLPAATTDPTEPLGCGVDFGCSCSRPYNVAGGADAGGFGMLATRGHGCGAGGCGHGMDVVLAALGCWPHAALEVTMPGCTASVATN